MRLSFHCMQIDGRVIAASIRERVMDRMPWPRRRMVAVLIGDDLSSLSFLKKKEEAARTFDVDFELVRFDVGERQEAVVAALAALATDDTVGGIVLQLPVPEGYDREALIRAIGTLKDVDNLSGMAGVPSPAVAAVRDILVFAHRDFADYRAVRIVGNGFLVGAPIARFCREFGIPHAVADIHTEDLEGFVRGGDLVITGVGKAGVVDPAWLVDGVGVIDFGFPPDFNQEKLAATHDRLAFYTPTPFGTGPILVAKLFENFYTLNSGWDSTDR